MNKKTMWRRLPLLLIAVGLVGLLVPARVLRAQAGAIAFRLGYGAQMTCVSSTPTAGPSRGIVWCKSTDSDKLYYTNPSGGTAAVGSGGGGGGGYATVVDDSGTLAQETTIKFAGAGVTCVDNSGSLRTDCTIPATVSSVAAGTGLSGGTITTTGTVSLNVGNANTWTASQNVASAALTDGATISTNAALGNTFTVTIAGDRTLANPTNIVAGGTYQFIVTQGSGGSHHLSYGADFKWPGGSAPTLSTSASAVDIISCAASSTSVLLCVFQGNFS